MMPPTDNRISQAQHGSSNAVDYSNDPDPIIYAPEDLRFDSLQYRGSGTDDAGLCLRAFGVHGLHQFAHLDPDYPSFSRGEVKKGQPIAKMGCTGYVKPPGPDGSHLHYWVYTTNGYIYPPKLYTEPFIKGGNMAPQVDAETACAIAAEYINGRVGATDRAIAGSLDDDLRAGHLVHYQNSPGVVNDILGWRYSEDGNAFSSRLNLMYKSLDAVNQIAKAQGKGPVQSVPDLESVVADAVKPSNGFVKIADVGQAIYIQSTKGK